MVPIRAARGPSSQASHLLITPDDVLEGCLFTVRYIRITRIPEMKLSINPALPVVAIYRPDS